MSTKNTGDQSSGINWPKTPQRKAAELEQTQQTIAAVAEVGQIMAAAAAVPQVRQKKLMYDAVQAANQSQGPALQHGKKKKGGKRSWQKHADKYFAENRAWDEVDDIRVMCVSLLHTALALTPLLKSRELTKLVTNVRLLNRNIQAITRDTTELAKVLGKVREIHKDKKGGSKDQFEMAEACTVFSQYVDFMERYDSALLPIVLHASEQLQEALLKLQDVNPQLAFELNEEYKRISSAIEKMIENIHSNTGADPVMTPAPAAEPIKEAA
jgi:hypothetical protein